jgi:CO dehydrogenase/acetyl-CoA synthase epsilon subunit
MWAAYAFVVLALISLPGALSTHDAVIIVAWIAQTFLQLVLLPIIIVGQNIQASKHTEHMAKLHAIHQDLKAVSTSGTERPV